MSNTTQDRSKALERMDAFARLLDSQFVIPGTKFRFGLDAIAGLIPVGGDAASFMASGALVLTMARHGASPMLIARMLLNIAVDAMVGAIPILGDLFDVTFKANNRNVKLLREHYTENKHTGSVWPVVFGALVVLIFMGIALSWLLWQVASFLWSMISGG